MKKQKNERTLNLVSIIDEIEQTLARSLPPFDREELIQTRPISVQFIDYLRRFHSVTMALKSLLADNFEHDNKEHAIGILLRSGLMDSIRIAYIISRLDVDNAWEDMEKQRELYHFINADQINYSVKQIKDVSKLFGWSDEKTTQMTDNLIQRFPDYFLDDLSYKYPNPPSVLKQIAVIQTNQRFKEDAFILYDLWLYYSKYEHFGPLAAEFIGLHSTDHWNRMIACLQFVLHFTRYVFSSLTGHKDIGDRLQQYNLELKSLTW